MLLENHSETFITMKIIARGRKHKDRITAFFIYQYPNIFQNDYEDSPTSSLHHIEEDIDLIPSPVL